MLELVISSMVITVASIPLAIQLLSSTACKESSPNAVTDFEELIFSEGTMRTSESFPINASETTRAASSGRRACANAASSSDRIPRPDSSVSDALMAPAARRRWEKRASAARKKAEYSGL